MLDDARTLGDMAGQTICCTVPLSSGLPAVTWHREKCNELLWLSYAIYSESSHKTIVTLT